MPVPAAGLAAGLADLFDGSRPLNRISCQIAVRPARCSETAKRYERYRSSCRSCSRSRCRSRSRSRSRSVSGVAFSASTAAVGGGVAEGSPARACACVGVVAGVVVGVVVGTGEVDGVGRGAVVGIGVGVGAFSRRSQSARSSAGSTTRRDFSAERVAFGPETVSLSVAS